MLRKTLVVALVSTLAVACRDGPVSVTVPGVDDANGPTDRPATFDPLVYVSHLMGDGFVRPMAIEVLGPAAARQMVAAIRQEASSTSLSTTIQALREVQRHLQSVETIPGTGVMRTEGVDGGAEAESLIIEDALGLIVDDALEVLLTAAESTGADGG